MISNRTGNDLLAALPPREQLRVLDRCERVTLTRDDILARPGARIRHAWFPVDSFMSMQSGSDGHDTLALGLVGREGMIGTPLVLDADASPLLARVQGGGAALRISAAQMQLALVEAPTLERGLRHCVNALIGQYANTARCAVFHVVEQRLACWLLMAHDRARGDRLYLTHDVLASLLGVRRSGVTLAAGALQRGGLIGYTRGHIAILDRDGLERAACACYRAVYSRRAARAVAFRKQRLPAAGDRVPARVPLVAEPDPGIDHARVC